MTEMLKVTVDRRHPMAVIYTEGYINNQGERRSPAWRTT